MPDEPFVAEQKRNADGTFRALAGPGRPSLAVELANLLAETDEKTGKRKTRILAEALYDLAKGGSVQALAMVMDRTDGKVPQQIDVAVTLDDITDKELETELAEATAERLRIEQELAGIAAASGEA
jgi:hypothetical protein